MWTVLLTASTALQSAFVTPTGHLSLALARTVRYPATVCGIDKRKSTIDHLSTRKSRPTEKHTDGVIRSLELSMHRELEAIHDISYAQSAFEQEIEEVEEENQRLMTDTAALGGSSMKKRMAGIRREAVLRIQLHELRALAASHHAILNDLKIQRRALLEQAPKAADFDI